ncbi:DUF2865 domain-containing protein [Bradyrhizobium viridifuturi]|jgi:hypothetical protein|uniref:DUF2865 domain-containing protein n=3 Tax=Nitrobacteraceae TaxID=41294 RepID=UPI00039869BD|nr:MULTISPECIES: DUF2865 domain-containing protein [Bradyrhizobium]ERF79780.1 MAG: 30S ribosomal protein S21 [Bradyrhizobium sp. DFCI-1]QRI72207.1 DUF2865 domain-containing protein [Bradyrhizobium sp. PSBB068]MBR1021762.1 DUF2865 domain-containing protein [Bradyrhizobium viridifuturi]MBR1039557.1 DUF2865 domain-containing protein [Bradyrhizobium viridifuturi]MBR1046252.1 DUF2865 domain-containing protein [Bradyrhizobium viridifuturi]
MPNSSRSRFFRWFLTCALLAGIALPATHALAQVPPGPPGPAPQGAPQANPMCARLEGQLAAIDRGGGSGDPARDEQIRRYQDAATRQQGELDRVTAQARRMGCDSSGFLSLFNNNSAQCGPVNNQIQQMRANLDQMTANLERLRTGGLGGADRENQRRSVLTALAQNNCGPQYAAAAARGPGNFIENLFGGGGGGNPGNPLPPPDAQYAGQSGTFRTVCVRTCDGAYFPISFATTQARFAADEQVCKAQCPAAEASLFAYRNPGEDINQAVSISGQSYSSLPNAFKYRTEFNPSCSCRAAGQSWAEALKAVDDQSAAAQQGDIIVTEESARKMQQRAQTKAAAGKKGVPAATAQQQPAAADATTAPAAPASDGQIRTVGPTFIQQKKQ